MCGSLECYLGKECSALEVSWGGTVFGGLDFVLGLECLLGRECMWYSGEYVGKELCVNVGTVFLGWNVCGVRQCVLERECVLLRECVLQRDCVWWSFV